MNECSFLCQVSKQAELRRVIRLALGVLKVKCLAELPLPWVAHIVSNRVLVAVLSDRGDEKTVRPELAAPQLFLDVRTTRKHFARCDAFDGARNLGGAVSGNRLHQEMDVVAIGANFQKLDLITLLYLQAHVLERHVYGFIEHHATILGRTHQMVKQHTDIMTLVDVTAHSPSQPNGQLC